MAISAIDLSQLPAPQVVEAPDYETNLAELIAAYLAAYPEFATTVESDPVIALLGVAAYREIHLRQRVNEACKAVMIAYAEDGDLDNLAALVGVERQEITPADPDAGTAAVMESNDELRERVILAPESFSVAGPELAYVFHARSAHPDVLDASVLSSPPADLRAIIFNVLAAHDASPALTDAMTTALDNAVWPGEVIVTALSRTGSGMPEPEVLDTVENSVNARSVRPLTDLVRVQGPEIIEYEIEAEIYLFDGPDSTVVLDAAQQRVETYVQYVRKLGRDINLSALFAALHVEGVQRVNLISPTADLVLNNTQAGHCTNIALEFAGNAD